ncbi:DUF4399 domain-containing protein [Halofilum ochraceum]|uniref:DUF4399 domain-containing protein n=1 Tax=Halofilum ochraceum TaxID=1611323 RepID=UPI0008DA4EB1|nr:DUF4399 domain-containing protein [Halofilum ochraceum]
MGKWILRTVALVALLHGGVTVAAERTPAPEDARLYFISPADGETVQSPVKVRFGAHGIGVAPAGVGVEATGHHHLIVDGDLPAMDQPIPSNDTYRHFGGGQTETVIELEPGEHTLQLLMGDRNHVPHRPVVASPRITIQVE